MVFVKKHLSRDTKEIYHIVKEESCNLIGAQGSLPHNTRYKSTVLSQAVNTGKSYIVTITNRQVLYEIDNSRQKFIF